MYVILSMYMTFSRGNPIKEGEVVGEATPASRLVDDIGLDDSQRVTHNVRQAEIAQSNPIGGALDIGKHMLEVGDMFGIDKATVGKMLLKGLLTGKFDLPGMKTETARRKKFEVAVDQIIKVAWSFLGIFLVLQTFFFVTTVILVP